MVKFSICVRKIISKNEFAYAYIRMSHNSKTDYIKTPFQVNYSQVKNFEITHFPSISKISVIITEYIEKLNRIKSEYMTVQEVKKYLILDDEGISFTTIAQNKCNAGTDEVAFCLNHFSAHRVTDNNIEKDFSRIDVLNRKVIDYLYRKTDWWTAQGFDRGILSI